ncbi:ABC transporter permease [Saccharothrix obliqua]|uniref:ABC transporter permease n=1 Tax=Saccharothrix obliqua TaxID=2861747 RepID=UPI001C5CFD31|nr:ABC transporter permease [Saccharothrix obliqua]MBW4721448.1 ABC transporter permease [Saccharothrix obliqua]
MTAAVVQAPPGAGVLSSLSAVAKRSLLKYRRTPQVLFVSAVQGVAFMLIFRYAFGGAIESGTLSYVDYLVPGVATAGVLFSGGVSAVGIAEDAGQGLYDRLKSLPMAHTAILGGRVLADTVLVAWCLLAATLTAFLIGFRVHTNFFAGLAAFGVVVLFGMAFVWVFVALGLLSAANPQAAQGLGFLVLPLSFASSAYVPVHTMPDWLRAIAEHQPVTVAVNAARTLTQGAPAEALAGGTAGHFTLLAVLWSIGISVVFGGIAVARIRKR